MVKRKGYEAPEMVLVVFTDEVVRTSSIPGTGEGELPVQPFFF